MIATHFQEDCALCLRVTSTGENSNIPLNLINIMDKDTEYFRNFRDFYFLIYKNMYYLIISYLIWILYSFFEGVREGNSKHFKSSSNTLTEIKSLPIYWSQRILILLILNIHLLSHTSVLDVCFSAISMLLIFPYIHSGTYFLIRNKLNPVIFTKRTCDDCDDTDDRPSMYLDCKIRTKLALISIVIQLLIFFIK